MKKKEIILPEGVTGEEEKKSHFHQVGLNRGNFMYGDDEVDFTQFAGPDRRPKTKVVAQRRAANKRAKAARKRNR